MELQSLDTISSSRQKKLKLLDASFSEKEELQAPL